MSTQESSRIVSLKEAVEHCLKSGMSESEVIRLVQEEVFGAAKLREAVRECLAPSRVVRMSYYEQVVDKKISNEDILSTVKTLVGGVKTT